MINPLVALGCAAGLIVLPFAAPRVLSVVASTWDVLLGALSLAVVCAEPGVAPIVAAAAVAEGHTWAAVLVALLAIVQVVWVGRPSARALGRYLGHICSLALVVAALGAVTYPHVNAAGWAATLCDWYAVGGKIYVTARTLQLVLHTPPPLTETAYAAAVEKALARVE